MSTDETREYIRTETLLKLEGVSLVLGGKQILKNVSGEIKDIIRPNMAQGQVVALLGRSGIGKTQLMRLIAGLQQPSAGEITGFNGQPIKQGTVGVVTQDYQVIWHRTVFGNLMLAARQGGAEKKQAEDRVWTLLKEFDLADHAYLFPRQLSGGQRQRVAILQQLLCSSHFLFMDEPLSGLDPVMLDSVCRLINKLANADELNTLIITTHNLEAAVTVADTLWLMGQDRDPITNELISGARIIKTYDLIELGLAWRPDIAETPECQTFIRELRKEFKKF